MAVLPFWPQRATLQHNVAHLAAFLVGASLCVAAVAGAAGRWVAVDYAAVPADGVPYSRGVWRSCRGAEPCADITPDKADDWERAVQARSARPPAPRRAAPPGGRAGAALERVVVA